MFANKRATRLKVLMHDGGFVWATDKHHPHVRLSHEQLSALVLGLPWQRMGTAGIIDVV